MQQRYAKPHYTGLDLIKELIELSSYYGRKHVKTNKRLEFNTDGYAQNMTRGYRTLIIDQDENGEMVAHATRRGEHRKLCEYKDPERAKTIIKALYNNPYYHSDSLYTERLKSLMDSFNPTAFKNINEIEVFLKDVYDKALVIHNVIKEGSATFGCAHRYLLIRHSAYRVMNLYLANFKSRIYAFEKKTKLTYNDEWTKGEYLYTYKYRELTKEDFTITVDPLLGVNLDILGNGPLLESLLLSKLNSSIFEAPPETIDCIRLLNQLLVKRGYFANDAEKDAYLKQLEEVKTDKDNLRTKFNELYVEVVKKAGYTVNQSEFSGLGL